MAELLLSLGATSSQADSNGCTAFHRYIEDGKTDLIDTLWDNDRTGIKTAINHIVFGGGRWRPETIAPLHIAIEHGDTILVLKLLNGGAKAHIDFETWLKAAKVSPSLPGRLFDLETNQRKYNESTEQPLMAAIRLGAAEAAIRLLERGADPNGLTAGSQNLFIGKYQRSGQTGESALDLVQSSLKKLREYTSEKTILSKPKERPGADDYLQNFTPGSYSQWVVSQDVAVVKKLHNDKEEAYQKELHRLTELKDAAAEKRAAVDEMIANFESIELEIINHQGKTFKELYPDITTHDGTPRRYYYQEKRDNTPLKPYDFHFSYEGDSDMTEKRRDGYIDL